MNRRRPPAPDWAFVIAIAVVLAAYILATNP